MACFHIILHRPTPGKTLLLALAIALLQGGSLHAQCKHIGKVVSVTPECGAVIKDLTTGVSFHVVKSYESLESGKTIVYSAEDAPSLPNCPQDNLLNIGLSCWSDTLGDALFDYVANPDNPFKYTFKSLLIDGSPLTCQWSFGDGSSILGNVVDYTFQQPGPHTVCLQLLGGPGIVAQTCHEILVSSQAASPCGYNTYVTGIGTQVYAKLLPQSSSAGPLASVIWTNGVNGNTIGTSAGLNAQLPEYGSYFICAEFKVDTGGNQLCTGSVCKNLTLTEPGCANAQLMATVQDCPNVEVPVCGCDGLTYGSECEALAAGITTWWAGDCNSIYGSCVADMEMTIAGGNPETGYTVEFKNLSGGNSSLCHLDFGDGSPIWEATQWETVTHHYNGGVYRINLSVWKQNSCASTVTKLLVTDAFNLTTQNLPDAPDYVLPGDANRDTKANVYDLLDIGVGYLATGAPRPSASSDFVEQYAANWPQQTLNYNQSVLNYKHFDCDGDGVVLDMDADLIEPNYTQIDSTVVVPVPGAPEIWVDFEDTIIEVDPNNPVPLEITANVMVGRPNNPALDLHGLAFALKYPEYVEHDPEVDYKNDFFGISNHILWLPKDNYADRQLDLGFTKKYASSSGFGRIATITFRTDFIIIIDVIAREVGDIKPFAVPIRGLRAVDANGQEIQFGTPALQDTLWIKLLQTSGTSENSLDQKISVYPNPATDEVRIMTGDLEVEHLEVVNALGQIIYSAAPTAGRVQRLQVADWEAGLYTLRLQTKQGQAQKKLMVH